MSIVKMKRLRLFGMRSDRDELLKLLQHMGCVEIGEPEGDPEDPAWAGLARPDGGTLSTAREERDAVQAALGILKQYAPVKGGLLTPRPEIPEGRLFDDAAYAAALETAVKLNELEKRINTLYAERNKLRAQKLFLAPWLELDVPLDTESTRDVLVLFCTVSDKIPFETVEGELAAATDLAQLTKAGSDGELRHFLLVCHRSAEEAAMEVLKAHGFARANLRGLTGTAAENGRRLDRELERLNGELEAAKAEAAAFAGERGALQVCADRADQEIARAEAKGRLLDTEATFFLEGWIPASDVDTLAQKLKRFSTCCWEAEDPAEEDYPKVPIKLKNGKLSQPLNMVTNMYVLPAYDGIDPNPLMAPFFIFFFGLMMADMGYGILMVAGAIFLIKKMKPKGGLADFSGLLLLCGISTFIMGAITGGFFGDFIPQLAKLINPDTTLTSLPALFTPLTDTLAILVGSLVLGLIQIITGMIISVVRKVQAGDVADAIWSEVTWWIILAGLGLFVLGVANVNGVPVVLIIGIVMLAIGSTRNAKGFGKVTAFIGAVYNGVTGYFSDTLSYARLMALMLAGSVIAQVFNTLGAVTGNVVFFIVVAFIGNMLNFALNLLGCYVHDLRLQCLEYFNRFYKEGGKAYKPLTIKTKYVDIIKEEN